MTRNELIKATRRENMHYFHHGIFHQDKIPDVLYINSFVDSKNGMMAISFYEKVDYGKKQTVVAAVPLNELNEFFDIHLPKSKLEEIYGGNKP